MAHSEETRTCGNCGLWNRKEAQDKAGRVRKGRAAKCLWDLSGRLPRSVRRWGGEIHVGYTTKDDGEGCPCWEPRKPKEENVK